MLYDLLLQSRSYDAPISIIIASDTLQLITMP